jgi:hypothetical protein
MGSISEQSYEAKVRADQEIRILRRIFVAREVGVHWQTR